MNRLIAALIFLMGTTYAAAASVNVALSCSYLDTGEDAYEIFFLDESSQITVKIHEITDWRNNQHTLRTLNIDGGVFLYDVTDEPEAGSFSGAARSYTKSPTRYDFNYVDLGMRENNFAIGRDDGRATKRSVSGGIGINFDCALLDHPNVDQLLMDRVEKVNNNQLAEHEEKAAEYRREAEGRRF